MERQVARFERAARTAGAKPTLEQMSHAVLDARNGDAVERAATADLYIETNEGHRLFFEIKSPQPNRGQCLEVTQRLSASTC